MKAPKLYLIAVSIGLVVGGSAGLYLGRAITRGKMIWMEMSAASGYSSLCLLQQEQADTSHARQALLGFVNFSQSMSKLQSAQDDPALLIDTGRAYLRLAAIEALAGNPDLSHQYVLNAQQTFRRMGRNIPEDELNKQVTKIATVPQPASPPS